MKHTGGIVENYGFISIILVGALVIAWSIVKITEKPKPPPDEPVPALRSEVISRNLTELVSANTQRMNDIKMLDAALQNQSGLVKEIIQRLDAIDVALKAVGDEQDQLQDHLAKVRLSQEFIKGASKPQRVNLVVYPASRVSKAKAPAQAPVKSPRKEMIDKVKKQLNELDR